MPDLTLDVVAARDEAAPTRDGSVTRMKSVTFYLGKFGPFTERFTLEEFATLAVNDRIAKIRATLEGIARA